MQDIVNFLIAELDATTLVLTVLAAFGAAVFHSIAGFGGNLLLSVLLAPIIGIKLVVPVVSVAAVISNSTRLYLFRESLKPGVVFTVLATALPCIVVGAHLFTRLSTAGVAALLGIFLLASVPCRRWLKGRGVSVGRTGLAAGGAVFGALGGLVIGAGLFLVPFLLGAGIVGEALVACIAAIGVGLNLTKAIVFGVTDYAGIEVVSLGVFVGLITMPGTWCGRWLLRRTGIKLHTLLVEALIIAGGVFFFWQAFHAVD